WSGSMWIWAKRLFLKAFCFSVILPPIRLISAKFLIEVFSITSLSMPHFSIEKQKMYLRIGKMSAWKILSRLK
ncbi:hypothetical protein, partial [Helicobacter suis]|uniref:hypothetical protein n=1 Tax=Helicobacter suis TaxID=104628 RepID=UPI001967A140